MGNLSATKKRRLAKGNRKHKKLVQARCEANMQKIADEYLVPPQTLETMCASFVRYVCHDRPDLMLAWSYPKAPRKGMAHIKLKNAAGDIMYVYGAPYVDKPRGMDGVKMAAEIKRKCTVDIPTQDFDVPEMEVYTKGIEQALELLVKKGEIFFGCMGGIGRTGLGIAGLLKLYDKTYLGGTKAATMYRDIIRKEIHPHAVETKQQLEYINTYLTN